MSTPWTAPAVIGAQIAAAQARAAHFPVPAEVQALQYAQYAQYAQYMQYVQVTQAAPPVALAEPPAKRQRRPGNRTGSGARKRYDARKRARRNAAENSAVENSTVENSAIEEALRTLHELGAEKKVE